MTAVQPRFLILGAGITGAALAHRLTAQGAAVTMVEAGLPAQAATGRSFGWVNASFYLSDAHFHLRHAAMAAHLALRAELALPPAPQQGCLWAEEEGAGLETLAADLTRLGYPLHRLDRAAISAAVPALATPPEAALLFPTETAFDPAALTHALLAAATVRGARLLSGLSAERLIEGQGRVTGIRTAAGDLMADHVILATGTATPALLAPLGFRLPMLRRPGAILRLHPVPPVLSHILALPGQEVRQDPTGCLIAVTAAAHQSDTAEALTDPLAMQDATLSRLSALFPDLSLQPAALMLAERPVPGDGLPVLGPLAPGLSVAVMHSGATLAPHVADLMVAELLGGQPEPTLTPFRPQRFQ